jgi:uncharacterized protein (TIGR00159 family)
MAEFLHKPDWLLTLLDLCLVACVVYALVRQLRETTAIRLLLSLPLLLVAYLLAQVSGLVTFTWLLDNFLGSILLVLVVIFQYDIRRAIISFNKDRLAKRGAEDLQDSDRHGVLEQLVAAAKALAGRKNGALIVIEREMPLDHFMEVGTEIDAKVTSELISSIFLPYSPIHDGAVIIQRGKLTKAGCFLPLTQSTEVAKELGTRHRAAIGLTELVDAVVIVVSEESGSISLVVAGKITPELEVASLGKLLRRLVESRWLE